MRNRRVPRSTACRRCESGRSSGADLQGCILRARDSVHERDSWLFLRVVGDRDALAPGERADEDVHVLLLDEPPRFLDRLVRSRIGPAVHDLDRVARDDGAVHALGRIAADRCRAPVDERKHRSTPRLALERGKGTFVVREDADLDRLSGGFAARRGSTRLTGASLVVSAACHHGRGEHDDEGGEQKDPEPAGPVPSAFSHRSSSFWVHRAVLGGAGRDCKGWLARGFLLGLGDDGSIVGGVSVLGQRYDFGFFGTAVPCEPGLGCS